MGLIVITHPNKVEFNGRTLIDLTGDDVTPLKVLQGATFHGADGGVHYGVIPMRGGGTITPGDTEQIAVPAGTYVAEDLKVAAVEADDSRDILRALIQGDITEISDDTITKVAEHTFQMRLQLKSVSFPNVEEVGMEAFEDCQRLESVYMPNLKKIGNSAFRLTGIEHVDFPLVEEISGAAFESCSWLREANFPKINRIWSSTFASCESLTEVNFPLVTRVDSNAFSFCTALQRADFAVCTRLDSLVFNGCGVLTELVLRSPSVCSLINVNALNGTPFASGGTGGVVYVPQNLIASYRSATNWSTLYAAGTCEFAAIEGSPYE